MTRPTATVLVLPAPLAPVEALLAAFPDEPAILWAPPRGPEYCGVGVAKRIAPRRGREVGDLRDRAAALLRGIVLLASPREGAPTPRLLGGLAFDLGRRRDARWRGFPAAVFLLPRWTYVRDGRSAWLLLAVAGGPAALDASGWDAECTVVERALVARRAESPLPPARVRILAGDGGAPTAALQAVRSGRVGKVVVARRLGVHAAAPWDARATLARLRIDQTACFRFALRMGGATFLGASPELLVRKRGAAVETEALAGTAPATRDGARVLLTSAKEADEHQWVVRALRDALAPHCRRLSVAARPGIRKLPGIHHLCTPVRGVLRGNRHVLDLLSALHPTPAVSGAPREAALGWIAEHEEPRGWYAGALGWLDDKGDGEFAVALRSGLLRGRRADLWGGAGIVRDSDPGTEMEEIARKRGAMLRALGVRAR